MKGGTDDIKSAVRTRFPCCFLLQRALLFWNQTYTRNKSIIN